jgi:DNA-binding transcriptional ArsR family regulator
LFTQEVNMKLLLLAFLLISVSYGATIENWEIDISLNNDDTADWKVTMDYADIQKKSDFYIISGISNLRVTADKELITCTPASQDIGTLILCENTNATTFVYEFRANDMLTHFRNFNSFSYRFNIPIPTDKYSVKIALPLGSALAEEDKLKGTGLEPFEPLWINVLNKTVESNSDGRVIFISWNIQSPGLGEGFDARIIYETFDNASQLIVLIIIAGVAIVFIAILFTLRKRDFRNILPVLTQQERKLMEILIREDKPVDQRNVIKELDYSKPKVSRIVHELRERDLITVERKGRKNLLKLKKQTKPQSKKEGENKA